jgi:hypothetical protein
MRCARALVQVGDVASIAVLVELSLPALMRRVQEGDAIQPAWGRFSSGCRIATDCRQRRACATCARRAARHAGHRIPELVMSLKRWMLGKVNETARTRGAARSGAIRASLRDGSAPARRRASPRWAGPPIASARRISALCAADRGHS